MVHRLFQTAYGMTAIAQRCSRSYYLTGQIEALLDAACSQDDKVPRSTIRTEMGRFRVWSENMGAHRQGRISLDYRLRQSSRMQRRTIGLLDDLISALQETVKLLSGQRRPYDEESELEDSDTEPQGIESLDSPRVLETEIASLLGEISNIIGHLYELSIIIRSSAAPRDLLRKAAAIDLSHFEPWDMNHVQQKFPKADTVLVARLAKANTRRRQLFRYLQNHHAKFSKMDNGGYRERQQRGNASPDDDNDSMRTREVVPKGTAPSTAFVSTTRATENTQTTVETFIDTSLEVLVDDAPSETTSAPSGGSAPESGLHLPELPMNSLGEKAFECPYCFEIMKVSSASSWRAHVLQDLQPYICTFNDCKQSSQTFGTRSRWFSHEADVHRKRWQCNYCQETTSSKAELETHLRSEHCGGYSEDQISALADVSTTYTNSNMAARCPLCLKEGQHLRNHLAKHMQTLALFVLPPVSPEVAEELDSNRGTVWGSAEDVESCVESSPSMSDLLGDEDTMKSDAELPEEQSNDVNPVGSHGRWADFDLQASHKGMAPLLSTASLGQIELVRLLANEPGSNVEVMDNRGQTALSRAAEAGASEVVRFLVALNGINKDTRDRVFRRTPLSWSAGNGHTEIVQMLLATPGIDVNAKDSYGRTPLWRAAGAGHTEIVGALLAAPLIEPDTCDRYGRSPLSWAAAGNHADVVLQIAAVPGVDVNSRDAKLVTPLSRAAAAGQLSSVRTILDLPGVDVNARDETSSSPLSRAVEGGYLEIVQVLLERGAISDDYDNQRKTPVMKAEEARHEGILRLLLEAGTRLYPCDSGV